MLMKHATADWKSSLMRSARVTTPAVFLFLVMGCGGGVASVEATAPPDSDDAPPADATPAAPPNGRLPASLPACHAASSPAAGATRAGVLSPITLDFDAPLDPKTITASSVVLLAPHASIGVATSLTYDDAHCRIVIAPSAPLAPGATYRVKTSGLASSKGTPLSSTKLSFVTVVSPWVLRKTFASNGTIVSGEIHAVDTNGRVLRQTAISSPGPDGKLGTPDDKVWYRARFVHSADGTSTKTYLPGPDGELDTVDDVLASIATTEDDAEASSIETTYADANGVITEVEVQTFAANGQLDGIQSLSGPDLVLTYRVVLSGPSSVRRLSFYEQPGPDGVLGTADDPIAGQNDLFYDALLRPKGYVMRTAGADGVFGTADDGISSGLVRTYAPNGLLESYSTVSAPGPNGVWIDADDVRSSRVTMAYDADGNQTGYVGYQPGLDKKYGTADDVAYDVIEYAPVK